MAKGLFKPGGVLGILPVLCEEGGYLRLDRQELLLVAGHDLDVFFQLGFGVAKFVEDGLELGDECGWVGGWM